MYTYNQHTTTSKTARVILISTMGCTVKTHTNTNFIHNLKAALTPNLFFIDTPHMQTYWCVSSLHNGEVNVHESSATREKRVGH